MDRRDFLKSSAAVAALGSAFHSRLAQSATSSSSVGGFRTGAEAVVRTLEALEIPVVFGIPGVHSNELWDTIKESRKVLAQLVTHEFTASYMADGFARATGKPGVLSLIPGPGLTNAASGIGEAFLDSVPMLVLITGVDSNLPMKYKLHDVRHAEIIKPIVKSTHRVASVAEIPDTLIRAYHESMAGQPGPVMVEIPTNYYVDAAWVTSAPVPPTVWGDITGTLNRAVTLIQYSSQVGIYVGMGAMGEGVQEKLVELATLLNAPVGSTLSGKGAFPEHHPLSVGFGFGRFGTPWSEAVAKELTLLIVLGARFSEVSTGSYSFSKPARMIHVDADPKVLNANYAADLAVPADVGRFLGLLLERKREIMRAKDARIYSLIDREKRAYYRAIDKSENPQAVSAKKFMVALRAELDPDDIVICDVGTHSFHAVETFEAMKPRTFFHPTDYHGMGYSVPAAIGAKRAFPSKRVVTITGDGSFLMSGFELLTAGRDGLPITIFVFADGTYDLMQKYQRLPYGRTNYTVLKNPNFQALAEALHVEYQLIRSDRELSAEIRRAVNRKEPVLVEVQVHFDDPLRYSKATMDATAARFSAGTSVRYVARGLGRALLPQKND